MTRCPFCEEPIDECRCDENVNYYTEEDCDFEDIDDFE